jgi:hypothetical protein
VYAKHLAELEQIVEEHGGGAFAVSIFLRSDGLLIQPSCILFERLAASGRLARFLEILKTNFEEALNNAKEEANRSVRAGGGWLPRADSVSGVQVGD